MSTYTYQWRCDGVAIPGATSDSYTPGALDEGNVLTCTVTATNVGGSTSETSLATGTVGAGPPESYDLYTSMYLGTY